MRKSPKDKSKQRKTARPARSARHSPSRYGAQPSALKPRLTVAIIGRPNVGKSTLFNRLVGRRRALVHDMPGVTRDRIEEITEWWSQRRAVPVRVIDTGGLGGEFFGEEIARQVRLALQEADVAIVLFDAQSGLVPDDREVVRELSLSGVADKIPVIGIVNKVDADVHENLAADFYALGLDTILTISAEHDRGIDEVREEVVRLASEKLAQNEPEEEVQEFENSEGSEEAEASEEAEEPAETEEVLDGEVLDAELEAEERAEEAKPDQVPRIAVVGRPNVGKSTFINALIGKERMITSPIAGTTTDAVDSLVELNGKPYLFVDTAGIRRKSKTEQGVEVLSVVQSKKTIERANIAILILDGESGIIDQDEKIGGMIEEAGCSVILAVNKWDTQRKNVKFTKETAAEIVRKKFGYLRYAPILFMSAKQGQGFRDLGDLIDEILHQRKLRIPTHEFTEWVREEATVHNPANAKFYLCHQTGRHPPTFVCHVNDPEKIHFSLKRHLLNALRERWGYMGTPVRLLFVEGKNRRSLPRSRSPREQNVARKGVKAPG